MGCVMHCHHSSKIPSLLEVEFDAIGALENWSIKPLLLPFFSVDIIILA